MNTKTELILRMSIIRLIIVTIMVGNYFLAWKMPLIGLTATIDRVFVFFLITFIGGTLTGLITQVIWVIFEWLFTTKIGMTVLATGQIDVREEILM